VFYFSYHTTLEGASLGKAQQSGFAFTLVLLLQFIDCSCFELSW